MNEHQRENYHKANTGGNGLLDSVKSMPNEMKQDSEPEEVNVASTPKPPRPNWGSKKTDIRSDKTPLGLRESSPKLPKAGVTARDKSESS